MLEMLCDQSLNKVFIILVVCTFHWTNISAAMSSKHPDCYFDGLPWIPFTFLCVYDMRIVLLKWNGESDSQSSSGDVVYVFMSSLRRHARFSVCVVKENARLSSIHS